MLSPERDRGGDAFGASPAARPTTDSTALPTAPLTYVIEGLSGDLWQELLRTSDMDDLKRGWQHWRHRHSSEELRVLVCRTDPEHGRSSQYLVEMFDADGRTRTGWSVRRSALSVLAAALMLGALNTPSLTSWALDLKPGPVANQFVSLTQSIHDTATGWGVGALTGRAREAADAVKGLRFSNAAHAPATPSAPATALAAPAPAPTAPTPQPDGALASPDPAPPPPQVLAPQTLGAMAAPMPDPLPENAAPSMGGASATRPLALSEEPPATPQPPRASPPRPAAAVKPLPAPRVVPAAGAPAPTGPATETGGTVLVFGDSLAQGLGPSLSRMLRGDRVRVLNHGRVSTGLSRLDFFDWGRELERLLREERVDAAVVLLGANDPQGFVHEDRRHRDVFRTAAWHAAYSQRVRETIERFRRRGIPLVWVGLPTMRNEPLATSVAYLNTIYRQATAEAGVPFIDAWARTSGAGGGFASHLPGQDGRPWKLRSDDGIHFSPRGYDWIAAAALPVLRERLRVR